MPISYALHRNNLTNNPTDYTAIVQFAGSVDLDGVIERMVAGGSTVTRADILAVLQDYHSTITNLVLAGYKITTPTANYGASIKGIFAGQTDSYTPSRHRLEATVSPGAALRRVMRQKGQTRKLESVKPEPNLREYYDLNSASYNHWIIPGGLARLAGYRLKFDPADPEQGIFFLAASGQASRVEVIGKNSPRQLLFQTPADLVPGHYRLEVRAAFGLELRNGQLAALLTVA